jgi:hypothetical protein
MAAIALLTSSSRPRVSEMPMPMAEWENIARNRASLDRRAVSAPSRASSAERRSASCSRKIRDWAARTNPAVTAAWIFGTRAGSVGAPRSPARSVPISSTVRASASAVMSRNATRSAPTCSTVAGTNGVACKAVARTSTNSPTRSWSAARSVAT